MLGAAAMGPAITYDVTRLFTRILNETPNGIDRLDSGFATHFLGEGVSDRSATIWGPFGPRLLPVAAARDGLDRLLRHWGEGRGEDADPVYAAVVARLAGRDPGPNTAAPRIRQRRTGRWRAIAGWLRRNGLPFAQTPPRHLPAGARYLNVSQFPLWVPACFSWLEQRPDVKAVFFIHDLLPIEMPEYFRNAEEQRHRSRMATLARFGGGAIVTTTTVRDALAAHLDGLGRRDLPILVAPTPMSPVFMGAREPDPGLAGADYFVVCSTIEPRKNHHLLLTVWRELVGRLGPAAPHLVVVGTRGWKFGPVADLMERSPALRTHVIEVAGLSTPGLRRLLDGARALLMPTFGEGYGLPVHEALAAGVPAIVSDIPAFREIESPLLTRLSLIDGEAWLGAIRAATVAPRAPAAPRASTAGSLPAASWAAYFAEVEDFLARV